MNVVTPESASSSETLFGGEKDYAAMYDMISAHSVAQIVEMRSVVLLRRPSGRGPGSYRQILVTGRTGQAAAVAG
jgi:hypothetical protein